MIVRRSSKRSRRNGTNWLKVSAVALGVAAIMFFGSYLVAVRVLFPPLPEPANGIVVPSVIGLNVPTAEARMRQLGLRITETTQIAHPTQPPGIIIAQNPLPGQQLRELGAVQLGVSSGLPTVPVPNVIGFTVERARAALASLGFQADERTEVDAAPAGTVTRISPPVGAEQPVPSSVTLFVSSGPPPAADTLTAPQDTVPSTPTNE